MWSSASMSKTMLDGREVVLIVKKKFLDEATYGLFSKKSALLKGLKS